MRLYSSAFQDNENIPIKYARHGVAGGRNISIPLRWADVPAGTKSFALVMVDVSARNWIHWIIMDIPAEVISIDEGASVANIPAGSRELVNTYGVTGYDGPEPPLGAGVHDYLITVYALSVDKVPLPARTSYNDFLRAIEGHILAQASLTGKFSR